MNHKSKNVVDVARLSELMLVQLKNEHILTKNLHLYLKTTT